MRWSVPTGVPDDGHCLASRCAAAHDRRHGEAGQQRRVVAEHGLRAQRGGGGGAVSGRASKRMLMYERGACRPAWWGRMVWEIVVV